MVKPRQEFLGTITKLAEDGSGIIDGYGAEIHDVTIVLNQRAAAPNTGTGRGSFWVHNDGYGSPQFTDSNGNTIALGEGSLASGTATLVDGYAVIVEAMPVGALVFWSMVSLDGVPGQIQIIDQTTSGFTISSSSHYDTSIVNWFWVPGSFGPMFARSASHVSESFIKALSSKAVTEESVLDLRNALASGKGANANQVLWNNGLYNVWTSTPKVTSFSVANGVSIGPNNCIRFDTAPAIIGFTNTTGGPGQSISISAQSSKQAGGNLNLSSGSGQTVGVVNIQTGGISAVVVGPGYLRNNGSLQHAELSSFNGSISDGHVTQGYDGRIAARLMHDYGSYTIVPRAYQQSTTLAPRKDKQFGGFSITKEGAGGNAAQQVLSFNSTILGAKVPACRKIIGTLLIGYARTGGAGSSALYLLDAPTDSSGNLAACSLTPAIQKHNGTENDVLAVGSVSSASTFDITITRPDTADTLEIVNYYWELSYGWA